MIALDWYLFVLSQYEESRYIKAICQCVNTTYSVSDLSIIATQDMEFDAACISCQFKLKDKFLFAFRK